VALVITVISLDEALSRSRRVYGFEDAPADSVVFVAAAIRRAAALLAPCTPLALRSAVVRSLAPFVEDRAEFEELVSLVLDEVVAYGDLIESLDEDDTRRLYLAAPSFVKNANEVCFLIGLLADAADPLPENLRSLVQTQAQVRTLPPSSNDSIPAALLQAGLAQISLHQWQGGPAPAAAQALVDQYNVRLSARGRAGHVDELRLLDPDRDVTFYVKRWRRLQRQTGRFVARRPQAYGADRWCYVELVDGVLERLLDLEPTPTERACDLAWRLQAALDALSDHPQVVRARSHAGDVALDFFSPLPQWLQRRLNLVAEPTERCCGSLMSYRLGADLLGQELEYLTQMLWMTVEEAE
jgi:hypothetical protein